MELDINSVISKTTINYALKRNIDLDLGESGPSGELTTIWFTEIEKDGEPACEPFIMYLVNGDGSFSFYGNVYLPNEIKEELPAYIPDEKKLREMIGFLNGEIMKRK